jgi:hypothetical protein
MRKKIIKTTIEELFEDDVICVDVPLFIRLLEYAREQAKTDEELHQLASAMFAASKEGDCLTMAHYKSLIPPLQDITLE